MTIPTDRPYVLLDDARMHGASPARLYTDPVEIWTANSVDEVDAVLNAVRDAQQGGLHAAGFLGYECGQHFLPNLGQERSGPLAWFGLFRSYSTISADVVPSYLPDPAGAYLSELRPAISRAEYGDAFAAVQDYIHAGDIYQANLTFPLSADYAGDPLALYAALRSRAKAGYGGVIYTGDAHYLSFSPELFFALKDQRVTTKPMKGTAQRQADPQRDSDVAELLRTDPKQRAENLMIVDLLRNDLSRVCEPGSVKVDELMSVETYAHVHHIVSNVTGILKPGTSPGSVIAAVFPGGTITGCPKVRCMEIIAELEQSGRGPYTGALGYVDGNGDMDLNILIRSLWLQGERLQLRAGGGIVADSNPDHELQETRAKAKGLLRAIGVVE